MASAVLARVAGLPPSISAGAGGYSSGLVEFGSDYGKKFDSILADLDKNKGKYDFYETDLADRIKKKRDEYDAQQAANVAAASAQVEYG